MEKLIVLGTGNASVTKPALLFRTKREDTL